MRNMGMRKETVWIVEMCEYQRRHWGVWGGRRAGGAVPLGKRKKEKKK